MRKQETTHKVFGFLLIVLGVVSYPLPVPGSTALIILGAGWFVGHEKPKRLLRKIKSRR